MRHYYERREFNQKKPDRSRTPDNIYRFHPRVGLRRRVAKRFRTRSTSRFFNVLS